MDTRDFNTKRYATPFVDELTPFTRIRIAKMIDMINPCNKLLDIGCWDGYIMNEILKKGKAKKVVGVDNSKTAIASCKKNGFEAKLVTSVDQKMPFKKDAFDAVSAGEVIEHLFDVNGFIQEIHRVLKPGGQFVLTTPNIASLGSRITLALGKIPWMIENELGGFNSGHIRYFTFDFLEYMLKKHNFVVKKRNADILHVGHTIFTGSDRLTKTFYKLGRIIIIKAQKK
ncbi:class I SAM-dependent methyltransferase [Candidatus Woesebacteria bacterium]|nr:class I SAM-dependent methyltransferase [Candidatus Woesebacteria bacterium]